MKKVFLLLASLCVAAFGQTGQPVNQVLGPTTNSGVYLYFYNGSNLVTSICFANAQQPASIYVIGTGLTNVSVTTNVGTVNFAATAQLWVGQQITLAGFATTALNGAYRVSAVSGSTATITTSGVGDATYNTAGASLATTGPILSANVWNLQLFTYSGSNLATSYYAGGGIAPTMQLACSNRANY